MESEVKKMKTKVEKRNWEIIVIPQDIQNAITEYFVWKISTKKERESLRNIEDIKDNIINIVEKWHLFVYCEIDPGLIYIVTNVSVKIIASPIYSQYPYYQTTEGLEQFFEHIKELTS